MLDTYLIEDTIKELENEPTNFENCERLACLYICLDKAQNRNMSVPDVSESVSYNNEHSELADILPAYLKYIETKKRYQHYEVVDKMLIYAMENLCKEIVDFVSDLYHNTETEAERTLLIHMISEDLRKAI